MKPIIHFGVMVFFVSITIMTTKSQTAEQNFNTLCTRVQNQGTIPPQTRYNFYTDKLNAFFNANGWKGDQVINIKEIEVMPPNDPSDWYYFVSVKTKLTNAPFYISYDIHDSNLGTIFIVEPKGYPKEFADYINKEKKKFANEEERKQYLEKKANEIYNSLKVTMQSYLTDTLAPMVTEITLNNINIFKKKYSKELGSEEIEKIAKTANDANYKGTIGGLDVAYVSSDYAKTMLCIYLKENETTAPDKFLDWFKSSYFANKLASYEEDMKSKIENAIINKITSDKRDYCYKTNLYVKNNLTILEPLLRKDSDYLKSKLETANEEQKAFYSVFLDPQIQSSFISRFNQQFPNSSSIEVDYKNMVEYLNNLNYFLSK